MAGPTKPIPFDPYGSRRRRSSSRLPRWLVLVLTGAVLGAVGVVVVQEKYLPPRLSADASTRLQASYREADADRTRLAADLAEAGKRLEAAVAAERGASQALAAHRDAAEALRGDLAAVVETLPPDPRAGAVAVRAARFASPGQSLTYSVVLSRQRASGKPVAAVLQLAVVGTSAAGVETTVTLKPVPLSFDGYGVARGSQPLPERFTPRQVGVRVVDRPDGKLLGARVIVVE